MFRKMSIKKSVNLIIAIILLIIVFFQILTCCYFVGTIRNQAYILRKTAVTKFSDFISQHLGMLENKKNALSSSPLLLSYVSDIENEEKKYSFCNLVYTVQLLDTDVLHVMLFDRGGEAIRISNNVSTEEFEKAKASYGRYRGEYADFNGEYTDFFASGENKNGEFYILKLVPIYCHDYTLASNVFYGTLCVFSQINVGQSYHLQSANEDITIRMYSGNEKIPAVNIKENNGFLLHASFSDMHVAGTNWYFEGTLGYPVKYLNLTTPFLLILVESLLLIVFAVILNRYLHRYIIEPFDKTRKYLENLKIAEKFSQLSVFGNSEMQSFSGAINDMVLRNKRLANEILENQGRIYTAETSRKDALIYALQNQINPHYMYNIFEIIRSIACVKNAPEIETIVVNLSEILRYNLRDGNIVKVKDEYDIILKYMEIMKVKYNNSVFANFSLPAEVMESRIMKMMFQPIVENAFNHGYIKRKEGFGITVSGSIYKGSLVLEFYDNGRGIQAEELEKIRASFESEKYIGENSIGLKNLSYRLRTFYGEDCRLSIESEYMKYTKITVTAKIYEHF